MIALVILAALDAALLVFAAGQSSSATSWFAPLHVAAAATSLRFAYSYLGRAAGWQSFALPLSAAVGSCGVLLVVILQISTDEYASADGRQCQRIKPAGCRPASKAQPGINLGKLLDTRVRFPAADEVQSLAIILRHGSFPARQEALETVIRSFEPRLSPLIATALADKDQTIRALAAAACAQTANNLGQRLSEFKRSEASSLDDGLEFGALLLEHANFNLLLPESRRMQLRVQACEIIEQCLNALSDGDRKRHRAQQVLATSRKHPAADPPGKLALRFAK